MKWCVILSLEPALLSSCPRWKCKSVCKRSFHWWKEAALITKAVEGRWRQSKNSVSIWLHQGAELVRKFIYGAFRHCWFWNNVYHSKTFAHIHKKNKKQQSQQNSHVAGKRHCISLSNVDASKTFRISSSEVPGGRKKMNFALLFINTRSPFWFPAGSLWKPAQFRLTVPVVTRDEMSVTKSQIRKV